MQAYRLRDIAMDEPSGSFTKTLKEAHDKAKSHSPAIQGDLRIELVEIETGAAAVIGYLNGQRPSELTALRTWKLSVRGGLIELNADGSAKVAA